MESNTMRVGSVLFKLPAKLNNFLRFRLWVSPLDVALCLTAMLMLTTSQIVLLFHLVFILLTMGAFVWNIRAFAIRSSFWVTLTSFYVLTAIAMRRTQQDEITEIPMLCTILLIVFFIARRRAQAQDRLSTLLVAEQEHAKRLGELTVLKADFTAMVAHELSSPLLAIRSYTDLLASPRTAPDMQRKMVDAIHTEIGSLQAIVTDVQAAATIERDDFAVHMRPVPARVLLTDAQLYGQTLPGEHPISIQIDSDYLVLADPERIGQVLRNLISNAAKYSADQTPIVLRAARDANKAHMYVLDYGYGIAEEDRARIFEKFGRGRASQVNRAAGIGLGLYLSQRILRAHGSDICVASQVGAGSEFSFVLEVVQ